MKIINSVILCLCIASAPLLAQEKTFDGQSRQYANKHRVGYFDGSPEMKWADVKDDLTLTQTERGLEFSFHITAPNGHFCKMSGVATKMKDFYEYREMIFGGECILKIFATNETVRLEDVELVCRNAYCGARGGIDGARFSRINE